MIFQVMSDLHFEFMNDSQIRTTVNRIIVAGKEKKTDALILAGDIHTDSEKLLDIFQQLAKHYSIIVFVPGNHDYYHSSLSVKDGEFYVMETKCDSLVSLNSYAITTEDENIRIIGCCLWSPSASDSDCYRISDSHAIKNYCSVLPTSFFHKKFLEDQIFSRNKPDIVITHFVPSPELILRDIHDDPTLDKFFTGNIDFHQEGMEVKYWIFGHSHLPRHQMIARNPTKFICNPHGYRTPHEKFDFGKTIEL